MPAQGYTPETTSTGDSSCGGLQRSGVIPAQKPPSQRRHLPLHKCSTAGRKIQSGPQTLAGSGVLPAGERGGQPPATARLHRPRLQRGRSGVPGGGDPIAVLQGRRVPPLSHAGSNRLHRGPDTPAGRPAGRATARSLGQRAPARPVRTFQVPIRYIAVLTQLDLTQMTAVDRMPIATTRPTARIASNWRRVPLPEDLDLTLI